MDSKGGDRCIRKAVGLGNGISMEELGFEVSLYSLPFSVWDDVMKVSHRHLVTRMSEHQVTLG